MLRLMLTMAGVCHVAACGWVAVGRASSKRGDDCWLDHTVKAQDTHAHMILGLILSWHALATAFLAASPLQSPRDHTCRPDPPASLPARHTRARTRTPL